MLTGKTYISLSNNADAHHKNYYIGKFFKSYNEEKKKFIKGKQAELLLHRDSIFNSCFKDREEIYILRGKENIFFKRIIAKIKNLKYEQRYFKIIMTSSITSLLLSCLYTFLFYSSYSKINQYIMTFIEFFIIVFLIKTIIFHFGTKNIELKNMIEDFILSPECESILGEMFDSQEYLSEKNAANLKNIIRKNEYVDMIKDYGLKIKYSDVKLLIKNEKYIIDDILNEECSLNIYNNIK